MGLHLIKLCVGVETLSGLADRQARALQILSASGAPTELIHITRQMPKRAAELLDGGSIYWVIKGWISARQELRALRPMQRDGIAHCALVYDGQLVPVAPRPRKAFQGWRYLEGKDAPADAAAGESDEMPDILRRELFELGLL